MSKKSQTIIITHYNKDKMIMSTSYWAYTLGDILRNLEEGVEDYGLSQVISIVVVKN